MRILDLTLPTTAENLALDEALLEQAETDGGGDGETLRFWQPLSPAVIVGRSSRLAQEVQIDRCAALAVPVLRRISGGAAIVTGPGCLMYAVVLSLTKAPSLRAVDECHRRVLTALLKAISPLCAGAGYRGTSDLTLGVRKFSGNSLRMRKGHVLYHGTLLCDFHLPLIQELLGSPPRQPAYREGRSHEDFVANLGLDPTPLKQAIAAAFEAHQPLALWPAAETARLVATRYGTRAWNEGF